MGTEKKLVYCKKCRWLTRNIICLSCPTKDCVGNEHYVSVMVKNRKKDCKEFEPVQSIWERIKVWWREFDSGGGGK